MLFALFSAIGAFVPRPSISLCAGSGTAYTAPAAAIGVFLNGILLRANESAPRLSYTVDATGTQITLNFTPDPGDRIYALCIL